ncbi:hypothetical protein RQP46_006079 [Phenoliferia psychrophenolica]
MDDLEHALASVALDSEDAAANELAGASRTPVLPPELITDIIDLTVKLLVEEERYLPSQALISNRFLLSAALVDRTWNAIATSALLKSGLVQSGRVDGFIELAERRGVRETLDGVRFCAGAMRRAQAGLQGWDPDDERLQILVSSLKNLQTLELKGRQRFENILSPSLNIQKLVMSSTTAHELRKAVSGTSLAHLLVIETQVTEVVPVLDGTFLVAGLSIENIDIYSTSQISNRFYYNFILKLGLNGAPCLRSLRLQLVRYHEPDWREFCADSSEPGRWSATPEYPAFGTAGRPSLASLEVLPDAESRGNQISDEGAESKLLELVQQLPVLRNVKVPTCWRSDAVEGVCEAKRVDLQWT